VSELRGGDLCVVVRATLCSARDDALQVYGLHVILLRACVCARCANERMVCWLCSGLPSVVHAVAECCLQKIPPASLTRDVETDEEVTV
jgi:hypothetical protein